MAVPKRSRGRSRASSPRSTRTGKHLWKLPRRRVESSPLLVGDTLYFGSWDHHLYALDVRGRRPRLKWRFQADDEVNSSAGLRGRQVFFGTDGGRIYAVRRAHRPGGVAQPVVLAVRQAASTSTRRPAVAYGRVFAASTDGNVYAYGATTGGCSGLRTPARTSTPRRRSGTAPSTSAPTTAGSTRSTRRRERAAGARRARVDPRRADGARRPRLLRHLRHVRAARLAARQRGPAATYALDARTGRLVWRYPVGHYSPVVADAEADLPRELDPHLRAHRPRSARSRSESTRRRRDEDRSSGQIRYEFWNTRLTKKRTNTTRRSRPPPGQSARERCWRHASQAVAGSQVTSAIGSRTGRGRSGRR